MIGVILLAGTLSGGYAAEAPPAGPSEARTIAIFQARVNDYVVLHKKLEATLPKLPKNSTPVDADKNQRALGALIKSARHDAQPGEFFTSGMQALIKRILGEILAGPDGKAVKASIMDENPGVPRLVINERYPSSVPLATMPPEVLAPLPKLPPEMEYRFVGLRMILLDTHADIIIDYAENILPQ